MPYTDRRSLLWLALGAALLPFTAWQTVLPLAGWLAPVFLLRFSRTQRASIGLPIVVLVSCVAQAVAWRNDFFGGPANVMASALRRHPQHVKGDQSCAPSAASWPVSPSC